MSDVIVELKEFNVEFDDTNTSKSANIVSGHDIKESFATIHKRLNNIGYTWGTERIIIDSNADLDNYKTPGIYEMISSSYTITHSPIDDRFRMYVMTVGNNMTAQYYIPENYDCIYTRKYSDISGFEGWSDWKRIGEQIILSYGNSTWDDFYNAYIHNAVVYCRASSNTNPATGSQTRMAFMAYVNNGTSPTEVEFQYYRSVSSHSDSQQGDQVFVYKLVKNSGWSVTTREASSKIAVTSPIAKSYSSGTITLSHATSGVTAGTYDSVTVDAKGHVTAGTNYQQEEINYAINTGVKNILKITERYKEHQGVTFTVNADESVSISGGTTGTNSFIRLTGSQPSTDYTDQVPIPKGKYKISCPKAVSTDTFILVIGYRESSSDTRHTLQANSGNDFTNEFEITTDTGRFDVTLLSYSTDTSYTATVYPMVRSAEITDNTFESYALPNPELTASEIELVDNGAKNKFSGTYTSQTRSGIAFTVNADGTITANRVSSSNSAANMPSTSFTLKAGTYVFSCSPNPQRDVTYDSYVYNIDASATIARDNPNDPPGNVFTITQDTTVRVNVRVASGYAASNLIFSPMICSLAEWNVSKKFVPYVSTIRELFESIQDNDNIISGYVSDNTGTTKTVITSGVNATKSVKDGTIAYITFKEDNTATYTDITTTGISLSVNGTSALIPGTGNECYDYDNTSTVNPAVGSIDTMYIELNPRYGIQGCTNLYIYKDFGNNNTKWIYLCSTGLDLWSFYNFTGISGTLQNIYMNTNSSGYSVNLKGDTVFPFALATCDTSASAQNKVASVSQSAWSRKVGCIVAVKYANTNTYNANNSTTGTGSITLNVNGTGDANIYYGSTADPTGTNSAAFGYANRYAYYMWDGTYWVWLSQSTDNNTTYSAISQANITNGSGTSSGLITGQRAKQAVDKFAFGTNTQITSGSNFDSYTTVGVYYVASDTDALNITHCPVEYHGRLEVITTKSDSNIMQIYYANISSIDCPQIFVRVRATNWGGWVALNGQSVGIHLSTGDDLDNIVDPGIYQCGTVTKAKSLLHTPFADATTPIGQTNYNSAAFKFIVENVNSPSTIKQTIIPLYGNSTHFERTRLSGVWNTWYAFSGTAVI
jgi:hypothetical protein